MGLDSEFAMTGLAPLVFDLETAPLEDARAYVDPPDLTDISAPRSYKKAEVIADYIATAKEERLEAYETSLKEKAALDWNIARIVCVGCQALDTDDITVQAVPNEAIERATLASFWLLAKRRPLVGFGIRGFDLPMLMQRSRYLGVDTPQIDLGRYAKGSIVIDMFDVLTFNDARATSVMRRSLKAFCRRFGIDVDDEVNGSAIPQMVAAGDWAGVEAHCRADVERTRELAFRVGVISDVWKPKPRLEATHEL